MSKKNEKTKCLWSALKRTLFCLYSQETICLFLFLHKKYICPLLKGDKKFPTIYKIKQLFLITSISSLGLCLNSLGSEICQLSRQVICSTCSKFNRQHQKSMTNINTPIQKLQIQDRQGSQISRNSENNWVVVNSSTVSREMFPYFTIRSSSQRIVLCNTLLEVDYL